MSINPLELSQYREQIVYGLGMIALHITKVDRSVDLEDLETCSG
jgi:hypothetical protein